jgi:hypothetical protein
MKIDNFTGYLVFYLIDVSKSQNVAQKLFFRVKHNSIKHLNISTTNMKSVYQEEFQTKNYKLLECGRWMILFDS